MLFACDIVLRCLDFPIIVFHVNSAGGELTSVLK